MPEPRMGAVYDYVPIAMILWPGHGPYILLSRVGKTSAWTALDVATSSQAVIVPEDDVLYERIA